MEGPGRQSLVAPAVLYVDDEENNLELFRLHFGDAFPILTAASGHDALKLIERSDVGVVLTDERMPKMTGIELLARLVERWPDTVRIIVSAYSDADRLLRAINRGHAHEYVLKPWDGVEMRACIERALEMARRRRVLHARAEMADRMAEEQAREHDVSGIVGAQGALAPALSAARRAAQSDSTVLLRGETGTGKELVARFVHEQSPRAAGPFVRVGCAALSEGVLESELFGHERGAFTGALRMRMGRFELAHGGTIFLDEIGDISSKIQVSLLRVLQEREIERVGSNTAIAVDVRVVAATHQDLEARIAEGTFRKDLFYRLNVIPIVVPPLRERPDDIVALLAHMIEKHGKQRRPKISADAQQALVRYGWPGNVRELENLVQRALVLGTGPELELEDFCLDLRPAVGAPPGPREQARTSELEELRALLLHHGGNVARAARAIGVPRTTLLARAKKHGLL